MVVLVRFCAKATLLLVLLIEVIRIYVYYITLYYIITCMGYLAIS